MGSGPSSGAQKVHHQLLDTRAYIQTPTTAYADAAEQHLVKQKLAVAPDEVQRSMLTDSHWVSIPTMQLAG